MRLGRQAGEGERSEKEGWGERLSQPGDRRRGPDTESRRSDPRGRDGGRETPMVAAECEERAAGAPRPGTRGSSGSAGLRALGTVEVI